MTNIAVCIYFKKQKNLILSFINKTFGKGFFDEIITVDTGDQNLHCAINKLYEFSGYQYALDVIYEKYKDKEVKVFFMNDTVFTEHVSILYREIAYCAPKEKSVNYIFGHTYNNINYSYIPTCFFVLYLSSFENQIKIVNEGLYDNWKSNRPIGNDYYIGTHRNKFRKNIINKLYPDSLFRGWYKFVPYLPPSMSLIKRKMLAIYMEHSMVNVLSEQNVCLIPLPLSMKIRFLLLLDKISINLRKVKIRMWAYICKFSDRLLC